MVRYLEKDEFDKVIELVKIGANATEDFAKFYLENRAIHNIVFVDEEDGELVAILQAVPKKFNFSGKEIDVAYIYAIATLEEHRKQGHMDHLFSFALEELYKKNFAFAFLFTEGYEHFERFGFSPYRDILCGKYTPQETNDTLFLRPAKPMDEDELASYSRACLDKNKRVYAIRDSDYFFDMIKLVRFQGGEIEKLVDTAGNMMAFCCCMIEDGKVTVSEITSKYGYEKQLFNLVCQKYGVDELEILADEKSKLYNMPWIDKSTFTKKACSMFRPINMFELAKITRLPQNAKFVANIVDKSIKENNMTVEFYADEDGFGKITVLDSKVDKDLDVSVIGSHAIDMQSEIGITLDNGDLIWLQEIIG